MRVFFVFVTFVFCMVQYGYHNERTLSKMNRLTRFVRYAISIGIFFFMLSNTISIEILPKSVHSQKMYEFFEGVASAKFGSEVSELTVNKEFISSYGNNGKNSYYALNFTPQVMHDVEFYPSKVYAGYYFGKLQTVQYFYNDKFAYDEISSAINKQTGKNGVEISTQDEDKNPVRIKHWCDVYSGAYVVLYNTQKSDENEVILSVADKKILDEELDTSALGVDGLPANICHRITLERHHNILK